MDEHSKFLQLLNTFDTAMLVTLSTDGQIAARPMAIAAIGPTGDLWFVSDKNSGKMLDVAVDNHVGITLQRDQHFISMAGVVKTSDDHDKVAELWRESWRAWFPQGKDDPALCLLHMIPVHGEYWDNSGLKGKTYKYEEGKATLTPEQSIGSSDDR